MQNIKKTVLWTTLILLLVCPAILFASGGKEAGKASSEGPMSWADKIREKYSGVTLNMSVAKHPASEAIRELSKEFTEMTGMKFRWDVAPETSGGLRNKQLMAISMGGGTYDIMVVDTFWITEYVQKDALKNLDSLMSDSSITVPGYDFEDFNAGFRSSGNRNNTTYALPLAGATRVVGYRKDLFEQYGKKEPKSLDELLELARFFKNDVPDINGMTMRARQGIQFASAWLQLLYQFSDGFVDQKTNEILINTPPVVRSLEYFIEILKTGPQGIESFGHEESATAFATGQVALWYDGTPIVMKWIENPESSEVVGKVGYMAPPPGPEGAYAPLAGWLIGISNQSKNAEAAWAFLSWATNKENAVRYYELSGAVNRNSAFNNPEITKGMEDFYSAYQQALTQAANLGKKGLTWIPPVPTEVLTTAGDFGNKAFLGEMTPQEACEKAAKQIESILKK
jgi:ABC-type glycerol-3-phosphate transport system substrate-binding protein